MLTLFKNKYEIDIHEFKRIKQLGNGRFGRVYEVESKTGNNYAAKVINCGENETECNKMIEHYIYIYSYTLHPTIIRFIGYSKIDFHNENNVTIITEKATNGSVGDLFRKIRENNPPTDYTNTKKQIILVGIARGMKYLHEREIIHCDLKPCNILLDNDFYPRISDFGLSKITEKPSTYFPSQLGGSMLYMAPEMIKNENCDEKVDVFAYGILMYEIVTDIEAYSTFKGNQIELINQIVYNNYRPEFREEDNINSSMQKLIEKCWSSDPKERPTFEELFNKLSGNKQKYLLDDVDMKEIEKYLNYIDCYSNPIEEIFLNKISALQKENKILKEENNKLKSKNDKYEEEILALKPAKEKQSKNIQRIEEENKNYSNENKRIKKELEQLSFLNNQQQNEITFLKKINEQITQEINSIKEEKEQIQKENNEMKINNLTQQRKIQKLDGRRKSLNIVKPISKGDKTNYKKDQNDSKQSRENSYDSLKKDSFQVNNLSKSLNKVKIKAPPGTPNHKNQRPSPNVTKQTKEIMTFSKFNSFSLKSQLYVSDEKSKTSSNEICLFFKKVSKLIHFFDDIKQTSEQSNPCIEMIGYENELLENITSISIIQIQWQSVEILFNHKLFESKSFANILTDFDELSFEIKYPSKSFALIYDLIVKLRKDQNRKTKLKLGIFISGINETDQKFMLDKNVNYIKLDKTIKTIATKENKGSFKDCSSLSQIQISSSVTEIENDSFRGCSSLKQISFEHPSSLKTIACFAFKGCTSLTQITIPSSVVQIENDAFNKCSSLKQISFEHPSSLKTISSSTFEGCSSLTQVTIPSSVTEIKHYAFGILSSLKQISFEQPSSLRSIKSYAFKGCSSLTHITVPSSVTEIGNDSFRECSSLTKITILSSITEISSSTFYECSSLAHISIPSSVTRICNNAFNRCTKLTQITVPSSVHEIGSRCFNECSSLTQVTFEHPSSLKTIASSAFEKCSSLMQIAIPSSVTKIANKAFSGCSSLTQITIPFSVAEIGSGSFSACVSLQQITFEAPSSLKAIASFSFEKCSSLVQIAIPSSVTAVENNAFVGCASLAQISVPSSLKNKITGIKSSVIINVI